MGNGRKGKHGEKDWNAAFSSVWGRSCAVQGWMADHLGPSLCEIFLPWRYRERRKSFCLVNSYSFLTSFSSSYLHWDLLGTYLGLTSTELLGTEFHNERTIYRKQKWELFGEFKNGKFEVLFLRISTFKLGGWDTDSLWCHLRGQGLVQYTLLPCLQCTQGMWWWWWEMSAEAGTASSSHLTVWLCYLECLVTFLFFLAAVAGSFIKSQHCSQWRHWRNIGNTVTLNLCGVQAAS